VLEHQEGILVKGIDSFGGKDGKFWLERIRVVEENRASVRIPGPMDE
jgi:hypothetical protein